MGHEVATTPIQMAMMASAIANGGKLMRPMLMRQLEDEAGRVVVQYHPEAVRQVVTPETARRVTEALKTVVEPGGTARRAALEYYSVAGKTARRKKRGAADTSPANIIRHSWGFFLPTSPHCVYMWRSMNRPGTTTEALPLLQSSRRSRSGRPVILVSNRIWSSKAPWYPTAKGHKP